MRDFRKLEVWKQGIDLVDKIYIITEKFPKTELYGMTNQVQRAAVSIPSNIAEGCSRNSSKEFIRYLEISMGSSFELETQLIVAQRRKYFDDITIFQELEFLQKRINTLINSLK